MRVDPQRRRRRHLQFQLFMTNFRQLGLYLSLSLFPAPAWDSRVCAPVEGEWHGTRAIRWQSITRTHRTPSKHPDFGCSGSSGGGSVFFLSLSISRCCCSSGCGCFVDRWMANGDSMPAMYTLHYIHINHNARINAHTQFYTTLIGSLTHAWVISIFMYIRHSMDRTLDVVRSWQTFQCMYVDCVGDCTVQRGKPLRKLMRSKWSGVCDLIEMGAG